MKMDIISISFYSTDTKFNVITSYIGCASLTKSVTVTGTGTLTGTANFELPPYTAYVSNFATTGNPGSTVWVQAEHNSDGTYGSWSWAGLINVDVQTLGAVDAFCIDVYTPITSSDKLLVNGPLPGTTGDLPTDVDWGKVNYLIKTYYSSYMSNNEAAALQCAIWYFTSAPYGTYSPGKTIWQFLTYSSSINHNQYDGMLLYGYDQSAAVTRAWQMINSAQSIDYPYQITLDPETTRVANGGSVVLTATVRDQNGDVLPGVTVNFYTDKGTLSSSSGTTNSNGQVSVTLYGNGVSSSTATVLAAVLGNYGNLLYDNPLDPAQNLVVPNLLSYTLRDYSFINFDATANVAITQTVNGVTGSIPKVNVGDTVTYIVTATNNGPKTATGILITDIVPAGLSNVIITPSNGAQYYNSTTGVWTIAQLSKGKSVTLTITGIATAAMAGTTTANTATRTAQDQYNSNAASSTEKVYTKLANVVITNTVNQSTLNVGDKATFTITVTNTGPDPANIKITDLLSQLPTGFTATPSTGTYTNGIWTITNLPTNTPATLTLTGTITAAQAGTTITNTATETQTEYPKTVPIPNASIYINNEADIALTQTINGVTGSIPQVNVGDIVTYIVTATNNGPNTAHNIIISDIAPALEDLTITPSNGSGTYSNGIWTINSLTQGAFATLTITGKATAAMAGNNTPNTATVTNQTEYDPTPATTTNKFTPKKQMSRLI
jgi:uncharacterized repeat protein (TIGR01451 family)